MEFRFPKPVAEVITNIQELANKIGAFAIDAFDQKKHLQRIENQQGQQDSLEEYVEFGLPTKVEEIATHHQCKIVAHIKAASICRLIEKGEPIEEDLLSLKNLMFESLPNESFSTLGLTPRQRTLLSKHISL